MPAPLTSCRATERPRAIRSEGTGEAELGTVAGGTPDLPPCGAAPWLAASAPVEGVVMSPTVGRAA
eukprot:11080196-Lingulodinium_polyedra.AAC.1